MPSHKVKGLPLRKVFPLSLFKVCRQGNTAFCFRVKDTQSSYSAGGQELQYCLKPPNALLATLTLLASLLNPTGRCSNSWPQGGLQSSATLANNPTPCSVF